MKNHAITLLVLSTMFLSACQQESAPVDSAPVVAEPPQAATTPAAPAVVEAPSLVCFVDEINAVAIMPETELKTTEMAAVRGWIGFMNQNGIAPSNFEIVLTSPEQNFNFPAVAGLARQDVADAQAKPGLLNSGYETVLNLKDVKPGKYEITMTASLNEQVIACGTGKFVNVK